MIFGRRKRSTVDLGLLPIRNPFWPQEEPKYWLREQSWFCERYQKWLTIPDRLPSDGATGAFDIRSLAWQIHDWICYQKKPAWNDGTPITAWQAAMVLHDILHSEGRHLRDTYWTLLTWAFGCVNTRQNGIWPWSHRKWQTKR